MRPRNEVRVQAPTTALVPMPLVEALKWLLTSLGYRVVSLRWDTPTQAVVVLEDQNQGSCYRSIRAAGTEGTGTVELEDAIYDAVQAQVLGRSPAKVLTARPC